MADVYFRMKGIDALRDEISRNTGTPVIHDTFYDARELAIDPFGNVLRFVEINPPGVTGKS